MSVPVKEYDETGTKYHGEFLPWPREKTVELIPPPDEGVKEKVFLLRREIYFSLFDRWRQGWQRDTIQTYLDHMRSAEQLTLVTHTNVPERAYAAEDVQRSRRELANLIIRVVDLPRIDGEDEGPTERAVQAAVLVLIDAGYLVTARFPRGSAATTVERGIHLYWRGDGRFLQVSIPAEDTTQTHLYYEDNTRSGVEKVVTPQVLSWWIQWLLDA